MKISAPKEIIEPNKPNNSVMFAWLFMVIISVIYAIILQYYLVALVIGILCYVVHALLWVDHIFYNPKHDYNINFGTALSFAGKLNDGEFTLAAPLNCGTNTCILPVTIKSTILGYLFDPYVELRAQGKVSRQYFERGVNGQRYLNLTRLCESLQKINTSVNIICQYCNIDNGDVIALGFNNSSYSNKRVLIIAPHADDAELAAFAFYKHASSAMIVTVTAGEVDAKAYEVIAGKLPAKNKVAAGLLKGRLRAWDSIAVPLWAGAHVQTIQLGYFCLTLKAMCEQPELAIASRETGELDVRVFRTFNKKILPTDQQGDNSWQNLVTDLVALMEEYQPEIIVTPHPLLDAHVDHVFSTRAILTACEMLGSNPAFLLYANHNHHTDMYPFGLEHSDVALPPYFKSDAIAEKLLSVPLSDDDQRDKICALQMMHDLNRPTSFKKQLRRFLQRMIGRSKMPYGDDEYLRKAVRQQELFWVSSVLTLKKQFE